MIAANLEKQLLHFIRNLLVHSKSAQSYKPTFLSFVVAGLFPLASQAKRICEYTIAALAAIAFKIQL
jgi:hypothetical protein